MKMSKLELELMKHESNDSDIHAMSLEEWEPQYNALSFNGLMSQKNVVSTNDDDGVYENLKITSPSHKYYTGGLISVVQEFEDNRGNDRDLYEYVLKHPRSPTNTSRRVDMVPSVMIL